MPRLHGPTWDEAMKRAYHALDDQGIWTKRNRPAMYGCTRDMFGVHGGGFCVAGED